MKLYKQNLKISGRNTVQVFPGENTGLPGETFHYFSQKKKKAVDHGEK